MTSLTAFVPRDPTAFFSTVFYSSVLIIVSVLKHSLKLLNNFIEIKKKGRSKLKFQSAFVTACLHFKVKKPKCLIFLSFVTDINKNNYFFMFRK